MRILIVFGLSVAAASCGGGSTGGDLSSAPVIEIDGSSTVYPITEAVAEEFRRSTHARVTVGISGTGGGFAKFCRDEIDIADASRPIAAAEVEACGQTKVEYVELPVAYDGLAVVVNPKNKWATSMTVAELKKLWEPAAQGQIKRWNQVRDGWPDAEVHLFGAGVDSGTFDYFTEVIMGKAKASRGDYTSSEDDNVIVQGVSGERGGMGYLGLSYYEQNQGTLKALEVDPGGGCVAPTSETAQGGTYTPLSRPLFVYVKKSSFENKEDVRNFIAYILDNEKTIAEEAQFVPLSDDQLSEEQTKLEDASA